MPGGVGTNLVADGADDQCAAATAAVSVSRGRPHDGLRRSWRTKQDSSGLFDGVHRLVAYEYTSSTADNRSSTSGHSHSGQPC